MRSRHKESVNRSNMLALAAIAGLGTVSFGTATTALAQSDVGAGQVVISAAGSTALKNWIVAKTTTFTDVQPNTVLSIDGNTYPPAVDGGASYWTTGGLSYQLAPKNNTTSNTGGPADQTAAIQFVYHESGSVEGVYELVNDQLYTNSINYSAYNAANPTAPIPSTSISYVTANVDRNPEGGNAVWLNYNQNGASGVTAGAAFNATTGANDGNGLTLGNFYGPGVGQASTAGTTTVWKPGSASNPTPVFNQAGVNTNGGQNAVQFALSDAVPQQVFENNYGNTSNTFTPVGGSPTTVTGTSNTSFNSNPLDMGYGNGNSSLPAGSLGTAGTRNVYQTASVLNAAPNTQDPRLAAGTAFGGAALGTPGAGVGPWNNASDGGLGNLNSQLTAITATAYVANPGTGLSQLDRTDANWLELTSRLANGAQFNMTVRDVNSGTRDVAALNVGVDPTWATGKNDNGNGNLPNGVSNSVFDQESVGPAQRFSNKTAGGAQLRPTVQNNRMAVGTLSINDAGGNDTQGNANPVRVLNYSDSVDGSSPYVSPNYATISNGTYVIYQNEQVVTVKDMSSLAAYNASGVVTAANGAHDISGTVQGDDSSGDVVAMLNNTANSVATANASTAPANPADGLLSQGYIIPSLMQVQKNLDGQGLNNSVAGQIATGSIESQTNPSFNAALYATYTAAGGYAQTALPNLTTQEPTTGTGSTYGGKGGTFAKSQYNGGAISITNNNYLFGNFNQDGTAQGGSDSTARDFNAVKSALAADEALIAADQAVSASVPGSEFTSVADNNANWNGGTTAGGTNGVANTTLISYTNALGQNITNLSKGDLIVMGDYTGDGHFDGADLVAMAKGAAVSDSTSTDRLSTHTIMNGVLDKNAALDYMNTNVPQLGAVGANATTDYIRQTGARVLETATPTTAIPFGASAVINAVSGTATVDPVSGNAEFTYDPTGVNTFNKSDVNNDGVVDFNDAVIDDTEAAANGGAGASYTNIADQTSAVMPAPVTGTPEPLNLVDAEQVDGESSITQADVNVINAAMTGVGNTNWYGYNLQKTGASTIQWARTGGTVTVYSGATFEISGGTVIIGGTQDPFSDTHATGLGTGDTAGNHVALAIDHGASLQDAQHQTTITLAGLTIDTASNSSLNIGDNALIIQGGPTVEASIAGYLKSGYNGGTWNGPGINTTAPLTFAGLDYGVGFAGSTDTGNPANLASGTIEVKYTLLGDTNLNGVVDGVDFGILAANFNKGVSGWDQGDFRYTGVVDGTDFADLAANFNKGVNGAAVGGGAWTDPSLVAFAEANGLMADVPEPATASLAVLVGAGFLARRRRR